MSAKLVSITTRAGDDITPAPMATRDSTHRQAIRSLAESRDIVYSQQNRIAEAVFRERKNRIADAFVMAIGSYSHSRHYDLSIFDAIKGAISLFWSRLRGKK